MCFVGYCPLGNTPRRAAIARWAIRRRGVLFRFAQYARLARLCAHFVARIRLAVRLLPVGQYAAVACYFASLNTHALLGYVLTSLRAYASPCVQTPLGDSEKTAIFRMQ